MADEPVGGTGDGPRRTLRAEEAAREPRHTLRADGTDGTDGALPKKTKQSDRRGPTTSGVLLGKLSAGDTLFDEYTVVQVLRQHSRDRAGLYQCRDASGADVVLKVAPPLHPPQYELWSRLPDLQHSNVMRTLRVIESDGLFCDVQEFCEGGSLNDRPSAAGDACSEARVAWITESVAPQLLTGLHYLHSQERVHRDVKPANVYVRISEDSETYALADLDVSLEFAQDGRTRLTEEIALTDEFAAPEAFADPDDSLVKLWAKVTPKSDYYSLGVTLLWLLCGTTPLTGLGTATAGWYRMGNRLEMPEGLPERLSTLLGGLLIRDYHRRWGDEATARWLREETVPEDLEAIESDRAFHFRQVAVRPHKLGDLEARDLPELAQAMQERPEIAAQDLLAVDFIVNWINEIDSNIARAASKDRETFREKPTLAVFAVGMLCDPDLALTLADGTQIETLAEVVSQLERVGDGGPDTIVDAENLERVEVWLRRRNPPDPLLADGVAEFGRLAIPAQVKAAQTAWLLDSSLPIHLTPDVAASTPREFARAAYGEAADWDKGLPESYRGALDLLAGGYLCAWLSARGLDDIARAAAGVQERLADHECAALETVLRLLDPNLPPVVVSFDKEAARATIAAQFGDVKERTLPFTTVGPGVPFGAVKLKNAYPGLQVEPPAALSTRIGAVVVRLDSRNGIPASRRHTASVALESGFSRVDGERLDLRYRVGYPLRRTALFVVLGAMAGAVVLGIPRLAMRWMEVTGVVGVDPSWALPAPPSAVDDYMRWIESSGTVGLWERVMWGDPFWGLVVGIVILGLTLSIAWRVWRWVLRTKSESGSPKGEHG